MNAMVEGRLVGQISELIDQYSTEQHELARRLELLRRARTELRLGRSPVAVLALLEEELGEHFETMIGGREMGRVFPIHASAEPPAMNSVRISLALRR